MRSYWRRVVACGRDIHLFLGYALISYLGIGVFALMSNLYLVELGYDEGFIGAFNAGYTLSMGLTCLGIGSLINRFGNWACIMVGTVEFTASMLAMYFATDGWLLLTLAGFNGVGSAFILTNQMPFAIEWTPKPHTSTIAALSSALNSASVMLGSLLGGIMPGVIALVTNADAESVSAYRWTLALGAVLAGPALARRIGLVTAQVWTRLYHVPIHLALLVFPNPAVVSLAYA